jgi:cellulose synthase (UDP-forming)
MSEERRPADATGRSDSALRLVLRFQIWDYGVFAVLTLVHLGIVLCFLRDLLTLVDWSLTSIGLPLLFATVFVELFLWEWRWCTLPLMRDPVERRAPPGLRVGVAVTFVPGVEPLDMLEETVRALAAIRYPHDTWVLDEGDDPAVRHLCSRLGVRHFTRRGVERFQQSTGPFRARTKYGNYNAWLEVHGYEAYDFIVAVDSDHILRPGYLDRVLGFFTDERVAFVQPAQCYYNQKASLVARAAAEETYAYYSSILMAAQGVGYPLLVGCHNTHRVSALREIGGFAPHEADDLVMALLYRARGWRGVFLPRILARGLVPADWAAYLKQQRRWARSVLDFKFRVFPAHARQLPFFERVLNYLHGLYYLRGVVTGFQILLLIMVLVTGFLPPGPGVWIVRDALLIWATMLIGDLYRQRFFLGPGERGIHWRAFLTGIAKWPCFVVATVDAIRGRYGEYVITSKARPEAAPTAYAVLHLVIVGGVWTAWLIGMNRGPVELLILHASTALVIVLSLIAFLLLRARPVPAYDPGLRAGWTEGQIEEDSPIAA